MRAIECDSLTNVIGYGVLPRPHLNTVCFKTREGENRMLWTAGRTRKIFRANCFDRHARESRDLQQVAGKLMPAA